MGELLGAGWDKDYATRAQILQDNGIALWDVLKACVRKGSNDADIEDEEANDFFLFFHAHPRIQKIGLNGSKAVESFERVTRSCNLSQICAKLPSTSSANSRLTREQKRDAWRDFILS